eukprot:gene13555-14955_t
MIDNWITGDYLLRASRLIINITDSVENMIEHDEAVINMDLSDAQSYYSGEEDNDDDDDDDERSDSSVYETDDTLSLNGFEFDENATFEEQVEQLWEIFEQQDAEEQRAWEYEQQHDEQ